MRPVSSEQVIRLVPIQIEGIEHWNIGSCTRYLKAKTERGENREEEKNFSFDSEEAAAAEAPLKYLRSGLIHVSVKRPQGTKRKKKTIE